ncbi:MAG TPA: DegT/DnrJ/EryC1/StrS family aminotransferase [Terriglobia bacterium]|nr:DegT/DnrJ/EryC1/StrS family aminotransferase [Terriglobia bacterium]
MLNESLHRDTLVAPAASSALGDAVAAAGANDGTVGRRLLTAADTFFFWKGRAALYAVLKALGVGPGDRVVVPGYTCFAVPSAILLAGAEPLYADIQPGTFNMALAGIENAVAQSDNPARVKAIILQHTYGMPADVNRIVPWARRHELATIEDCAHVWGSRYQDERGAWRAVGTAGDASFFSSHWTKPVSTGLGGWVTTADRALSSRLRSFHDEECSAPSFRETALLAAQVAGRELLASPTFYWMARDVYRRLYGAGLLVGSSTQEELKGIKPKVKDYTKRMSGFQRWLLNRRRSDESVVTFRKRLKITYDGVLASAGFSPLVIPEGTDAVLLRYPVRVSDKGRVLKEAERCRIELGDWYRYPVDRPDGVDAGIFGYRDGMCPEGERAARETVTLPMNDRVTERQVLKAVQFLRDVR